MGLNERRANVYQSLFPLLPFPIPSGCTGRLVLSNSVPFTSSIIQDGQNGKTSLDPRTDSSISAASDLFGAQVCTNFFAVAWFALFLLAIIMAPIPILQDVMQAHLIYKVLLLGVMVMAIFGGAARYLQWLNKESMNLLDRIF